jgi:UDP-glucose 4-epimerase
VNGTLNVLMAARDEEVRRIVFASSSSVYGDTQILPKHEGMPVAPMSPYAASKLASEGCMQSFAATYGMETISLRFFNVFGPNQNPASEYAAVVPRFISRILSGAPPLIFGDGYQSRDFTFVANVVQACLLAADAGPEAMGQVVNVGCGMRTSLLDLVEAMNQLLGTELRPSHLDPRPGDVRDSQADVSKAQQVIGYRPLVSFREGLRRTIDWMAERRAAVGAG